MSMGADWPREHPAVAMKDAAKAAAAQGVELAAFTWTEFTCDYPASDVRRKPVWVFAFSETLSSGGTLNYRVFVDGITVDVQTSEPPEKYGWENGRNVRWVELIPQGGGAWKVSALSSSP